LETRKSGNPSGKDSYWRKQLKRAILKVEREDDINYLVCLVRKSLAEPSLATAILRKLLPDLKAVEVKGGDIEKFQLVIVSGAEQLSQLEQLGKGKRKRGRPKKVKSDIVNPVTFHKLTHTVGVQVPVIAAADKPDKQDTQCPQLAMVPAGADRG